MILDFFARSWFFLDFLATLIAKILARLNAKILARNEEIQDLDKKFKIIQDYPRSWQENQYAKHWVQNYSKKLESPNVRWSAKPS